MASAVVNKQARQDLILEIIKNHEVHNQLELLKFLEDRGVVATQSSVSRDIHELAIAKVEGRYVIGVLPIQKTADASADGDLDGNRPFVKSMAPAGPNLLVVKTPTGCATSVGLLVDKARWPEVLGTVASDDTIFLATFGKREQMRLMTRLQEFMERGAEPIQIPQPEDSDRQLSIV